jgi:hypothetical protein
MLNNKVLKYIKLITTLKCRNINTIKNIKDKTTRCCCCLQLYGLCIRTSASIVYRDFILLKPCIGMNHVMLKTNYMHLLTYISRCLIIILHVSNQ